MNKGLQLKIIAFIVSIAFFPIILIGAIFSIKYISTVNNSGGRYVEALRDKVISEAGYALGEAESSIKSYSPIFINAIRSMKISDINSNAYTQKELFGKMKGLENIYIFSSEKEILYSSFENRGYEDEVISILKKHEFIEPMLFLVIKSGANPYIILIKRLEEEKTEGYAVYVMNMKIFEKIENIGETSAVYEVYNRKYEVIKTNGPKKILSAEINSLTKEMEDGVYKTISDKNRFISFGAIPVVEEDLYILIYLDKAEYLGKNNFIAYIFFASIFAVIAVFIMGGKLVETINEYIDEGYAIEDYDYYSIKKLDSDLERTLVDIERTIESQNDFQVLKQDIIKLRERFGNVEEKSNSKSNK